MFSFFFQKCENLCSIFIFFLDRQMKKKNKTKQNKEKKRKENVYLL